MGPTLPTFSKVDQHEYQRTLLDVVMRLHYLLAVPNDLFPWEPAMAALAYDVSKLTDRYQTTVPSGVRKQLELGKGDQIRYLIEPSGRVYIEPRACR